jgi:hypothetical protein
MCRTLALVYFSIVSFFAVACFNNVELENRYVAPELLDGTVVSMSDTISEHCGGRERIPFIVLVSRMPEGASDSAIGHCTKTPGGAIYLLRDFWLSASDKRRMFLLLHEWAHCGLGLLHNELNWVMQSHLIPEDIAVEKTIDEAFEAIGCKK